MSTVVRRRLAPAVLAAAVLTAAGCGSGSQNHDPETDGARPVDLSAAPAEVTWRPYQGVQVPYSAADGPTADAYSAAPRGYTDTPQGAVLAAMQGQTRLALAPDGVWTTAAAALLAPGPGRDAYAVARAAASIRTAADPATTAAFTGFRVNAYGDGRAVVDLATTMPGGQVTAVAVTLTRRSGDWQIDLPSPEPDAGADDPTAPAPTDPVPLSSLDGFTAFSAP
ncbi:hypothetical protein SAMN05444374_103264 [Rhodococcoides kroppenstedtii]|uniref:DUF8175 domain-containing protein n=1 Tax=Rhodococcoides kroppenstedtii TaxID=293050 RepID=A0A1I0T0X2_9NOCA|nr:hypothetical protein [Rhodococcus kroppenstedtii]SFA45391.1 hypothetical protein SAMN05444374_103264 [Rhodococcus kroppenstedtii]